MNDLINRTGTLQAPQLDYVLLDGSSSMAPKWWDTIAALRGYVDVLRSQNINSHGIIQLFDSYDLDCELRNGTIESWKDLSDLGYHGGMTPLYDAINLMARKLRDLDPPKCSIVIVTDGDENGSNHTNADQARAMLDWCRAKGWQVTFLGADFNNSRQAKLLGANDSNSVGVQQKRLGEAGKALGEKRVKHALFGDDINFSEDERKDFGGYLTNGNGNGK
jgi:von Willebrand factor type A domain